MITITLTYNQLVLLRDAFATPVVLGWDVCSQCNKDFLLEHAADFVIVFNKKIKQSRKKYLIKFSSLQAFAFIKIWKNREMPLDNTAALILEMIGCIDEANQHSKLLYAHR